MSAIVIADVSIRQDHANRYCLNDLHRASGAESRHQPAFFLRRPECVDLITEISNSAPAQNKPVFSTSGRYGGTFVSKELVYTYAMWVSAAFHLKVVRAYDALISAPAPQFVVPQTMAEALRLAADQMERREAAERQLMIQAPKVEFADAVRHTDDTVDFNAMAKTLGWGRNKLMAKMREDAVLMVNNLPYQKYIDRGYFSVAETIITRTAGPTPVFSARVTGAGQVFLQRKYAPAMAE